MLVILTGENDCLLANITQGKQSTPVVNQFRKKSAISGFCQVHYVLI